MHSIFAGWTANREDLICIGVGRQAGLARLERYQVFQSEGRAKPTPSVIILFGVSQLSYPLTCHEAYMRAPQL